MLNKNNINYDEQEQEEQEDRRGIIRTDYNIAEPYEPSADASYSQGRKRITQMEAQEWLA